MAIQANDTHQYPKGSLARAALADWCDANGKDMDDYQVCTAQVDGSTKHGWVELAVWEAEQGIRIAETEFGPVIESKQSYSPSQIGFMLDSDDDLPDIEPEAAAFSQEVVEQFTQFLADNPTLGAEVESDKVSIKPLRREGAQQLLPLAEAINEMR